MDVNFKLLDFAEPRNLIILFTEPPSQAANQRSFRPVLSSIIGLVVEFVVAIDEARVRFTDDALTFCLFVSYFAAEFLPIWQTTWFYRLCHAFFFF